VTVSAGEGSGERSGKVRRHECNSRSQRGKGWKLSSTSSSTSSGGIGFTGLLTIVFITLKLLHKIAWSWWWVLSPLWISAAFGLLILALLAAVWGALVVARKAGWR
jgi:hypothetical protein